MNFSKSLSIYDTHLNSVFLGNLEGSCDRAASELDSTRGLEQYIFKIETLMTEINKEYEACANL